MTKATTKAAPKKEQKPKATPQAAATIKEVETPAEQPEAPAEQPEQNEIIQDIIWYELDALRKQQVEAEPLHVLVYFRTEKIKDSKTNAMTRHGRITFSKFLSEKMNNKTKIKFGSLDGKIVFQINDKEGFNNKLGSKMYTKRVVSNCHIAEIIFDRFKLRENKKSVAIRLKDLGNDFYLIDKVIK